MAKVLTEAVDGTPLSLECIDNVQGRDGLALGVLSVRDCVAERTLEEILQDSTAFLVNKLVRLCAPQQYIK